VVTQVHHHGRERLHDPVGHLANRGSVVGLLTPTGQVDLATRGLSLEAVDGIVNELLPAESQRALDEFGAVQYELPAIVEFPGEQFIVVAARGGDDLWAEIRRNTIPEADRVPMDAFASTPDDADAITADPTLEVPDVAQLWPGPAAPSESPPQERIEAARVLPPEQTVPPAPVPTLPRSARSKPSAACHSRVTCASTSRSKISSALSTKMVSTSGS